MCCGQDEGLVNHHLVQCLLEGADCALDIVQLFESKPVSYTHLTLPTNREV